MELLFASFSKDCLQVITNAIHEESLGIERIFRFHSGRFHILLIDFKSQSRFRPLIFMCFFWAEWSTASQLFIQKQWVAWHRHEKNYSTWSYIFIYYSAFLIIDHIFSTILPFFNVWKLIRISVTKRQNCFVYNFKLSC